MPSIMLKACVTSCGSRGCGHIYYKRRVRTSDSLFRAICGSTSATSRNQELISTEKSTSPAGGLVRDTGVKSPCMQESPRPHKRKTVDHFLRPDTARPLCHRPKNCLFFPRLKIANIYWALLHVGHRAKHFARVMWANSCVHTHTHTRPEVGTNSISFYR